MATPSQGDSAATLLAKLQARNRVEVDAFRAVFEAHAGAQRQARVLQERVATLNRRCAELSEGKERWRLTSRRRTRRRRRGPQ